MNDQSVLLWICRGDEQYGVARSIITLSESLSQRGWTVLLGCSVEGDLVRQFRERGWTVVLISTTNPLASVSGGFIRKLKGFREVGKYNSEIAASLLRSEKLDEVTVVQTFNILLLKSVAIIAKEKTAIAIWRTANYVKPTVPFNYWRRFLQLRLSRWNIIAMGTSNFTASSLGSGNVTTVVNYHGSDPSVFDPDTVESVTKNQLGLSTEIITFGVVARIYENDDKGQLLTALSMRHVANKLKLPMALVIVGGPSNTQIEKRIQELVKNSRYFSAVFTGSVPDVQRYYGCLDVAVNCRRSAEPFGLSVIEGMMMSTPMLVHSLGGPAETVRDGIDGWHCSEPTLQSMEKTISRALADKSKWLGLGQSARNRAISIFTISSETDRWIDTVEGITAVHY